MDMPPHARAGQRHGRGHRFAAYPRCSTDSAGDTMAWLARLLNARSRREMEGLVLAEHRWQIVGSEDPARLFASLVHLVPAAAYLFLEGGSHPPKLRGWLEAHDAAIVPRPALGTIWPAAPFFSVSIVPGPLDELAELTKSLASPEVCDHLHVVAGERMLVSGYDAFSDPFYVSGTVPEQNVREFCDLAGCTYERLGDEHLVRPSRRTRG
jgi:hypothetical protein